MEPGKRVSFGTDPTKDDDDTTCGFGSFRPQWLQRLADPKAYLFLFCALGVLQGAYFTYTVGIISTIEKRYAFDSKISGIILIADNLSPILTSLFIGFYGGRAHRPRLVAFGMLFVCLSCLMSALPYLVFGPGTHLLESPNPAGHNFHNGTKYHTCSGARPEKECGSGHSSAALTAVSLFFIANFFNGFGSNAVYTAGISYLDDNIKKKDSPMYFSLMMAVRMFGPSLGFFMSSVCLRYYEDPRMDPGLSLRDPRWVGAWWMGYLIIFIFLFVFTIPMFLFPKTLSKTLPQPEKTETVSKMPSLKDMPRELLKLSKNKIYVFHTLSIIFIINGYMGYYILLPKYMEFHFRKSASEASLVSGSTGLLTMLFGLLLGGVVIRKFRPRARILTGYMVFVQVACVSILTVVMFLSCSPPTLNAPVVNGQASLINQCNANCDCSTHSFQPACGPDLETLYFSPCHAGCTGYGRNDTTNATIFTSCSCTTNSDEPIDLASGFCPFTCKLFLTYILISCVAKLVSSTGRVGNTLITLRCVDPEQKTLALGVLSCVMCLFAMIPHPLVFGAIADSSCLVWEETCGRRGNCWLYDVDKLRLRLHGAAIAFVLLGVLCDIMVWWYSNTLPDLFEELHGKSEPAKSPPEDGVKRDVDSNENDEDFVLKPVASMPTGTGSDIRSNI